MKRLLFILSLIVILSIILIHFKSEKFRNMTKFRQVALNNYGTWLEEQTKRKRALRKSCRQLFGENKNISMEELRKSRLFSHLIVDDIHKSLYCFIPKVTCTQWKIIMMILSGRTRAKNITDPIIGNPHLFGKVKLLGSDPFKASTEKLKRYKKFVFVRHPFERIVSAYRDKLESVDKNQSIRNRFGAKIIEGFKFNDTIRFPEFVDYIIRTDKQHEQLEDHWAKFDDLCHPCDVEYDFLGYYNTILYDSDHILRNIGASPKMRFPQHTAKNTSCSVFPKYWGQLSEQQKERLYKVYYKDFVLFGFNKKTRNCKKLGK